MKDIETREDLEILLREFYTIATQDDTIGHHFADLDLEAHLPVIIDFWDKALFRNPVYYGNPLLVHKQLHEKNELKPTHFDQWEKMFRRVIDQRFSGVNAEAAKERAQAMSTSIGRQLNGGGSPYTNIG